MPESTTSKPDQGGKMRQTMQRHWCMLRLVPKAPQKITAGELCRRLASDSFIVTERTIQRDLVELSALFPLISDEREKPFGWSWKADAPRLDLPGLDAAEALMMVMVEQHLKHVLPPATVKRLKPHFDLARDALAKLPDQRSNRAWLKKVRVIAPMQRLEAPAIKADVQEAVFNALLAERQLEVKFRQRNAERDSGGVVHPLAIVQRGAVTYLICTFYTYTDYRLLTLHRIQQAKVLDEPAKRPTNFSVDQLINDGLLGFGESEPIQLVAEFYDGAGEHLFETPISPQQQLERLDNNIVRLTAPVQLTNELRWWLLGFGARVEVIAPETLREEMAAEVKQASSRYAPT